MKTKLLKTLTFVTFSLATVQAFAQGGMSGDSGPDSWTWNSPGSGRTGGGTPSVDWDNIGNFDDKSDKDTQPRDRDNDWRDHGSLWDRRNDN